MPVRPRLVLSVQLALTLMVLAWLPGNGIKLAAFVAIWSLSFGRLDKAEWWLFAAGCTLFTFMNAMALENGIFAFTAPDVLGMPWFELFMWGFYLLHTWRFLGGPVAPLPRLRDWLLVGAFAGVFAVVTQPTWLFVLSSSIVCIALAVYRTRHDFAYVLYMIALGAAIEYTGVVAGQWQYPSPPPGGVPFWFMAMWGGVGLFLRRVAIPLARLTDRVDQQAA